MICQERTIGDPQEDAVVFHHGDIGDVRSHLVGLKTAAAGPVTKAQVDPQALIRGSCSNQTPEESKRDDVVGPGAMRSCSLSGVVTTILRPVEQLVTSCDKAVG